jgi:Legume lectin domain/Chitobiase/beta-hexosaminidase C-terminal domain
VSDLQLENSMLFCIRLPMCVFRRSQVACLPRTAFNALEMPSNQLRLGDSITVKRREFNQSLAAATAVILSPFPRVRNAIAATVGGATPVFSYPNGFAGASGAINLCDAAVFGSSSIVLLNNSGHNHGGAWYKTKQPPTPFTTVFTFQTGEYGPGVADSGMTFCIQNTVAPPGAAGQVGMEYAGDANMCGYGGGVTQNFSQVNDSIAIKFDAGNQSLGQGYPAGGLPSSTGLYFNGGPAVATGSLGLVPFNDLNPCGISFYPAGHMYQVTIVYDGSLLTMVLLDTATNAQARFVWPLNLANTTNTTGNYVGFTAGTAVNGLFEILSWSYWSGYNTRLAMPTLSPTPGQYSGTQTVTMSFPSGSTCYYTTNGHLPTSSSTKYTGPITVSANQVIQAVAIQSGFTDSLVATGAYQINTSNVINFPSGFSAGNLVTAGFAYLSGSAIRVSDTTPITAGAAWFPAPVTITSFSTTFTLQWGSSGQGMCFVIQNNAPAYASPSTAINWSGGPTVVGAAGNALGYAGLDSESSNGGKGGTSFGLLNSIAIAFDQFFVPNSVGLYTNGNNPQGSQIATGLTFSNGHPFQISLSYSGNTLSFTMKDTVTGATFTHNFSIDIPSTVGANTAYVGFTGGTGGATSVQAVQSWTYTASSAQAAAVPAAPTNLVVK